MTKQNKIVSGIIAGALTIAASVAVVTNLTTPTLQKIDLPIEDAFVNQHFKDDFKKLVDNDITTRYTQWSPRVVPYQINFPFYNYDTCAVKQIRFRYNNGNASSLKFYYTKKDNGEKVLLYSYTGGSWDSAWKIIDIPSATAARSFVIESKGGDDFPDDIELYGNFSIATQTKSAHTPAPLGDLLGVVCKPWDVASDYMFPEKIPVIQSLGANRIRLYNDYVLCHDASGNLIENNVQWHQAVNMALLKSKGIATQMCYHALPSSYPWPPTDKNDPASYLKLAKDVYQFGIWNKAGGEYSKVFELLNEPGAWYINDTSQQMDGYQLAAMCSMAYDGHKGKYPRCWIKSIRISSIVFYWWISRSRTLPAVPNNGVE
jgi:hypothetical protein